MNKAKDERKRGTLAGSLLAGGALLGLLQDDPDAWFKGSAAEGALQAEAIEAMIAARIEARRAKNFAEADRIRDDLLAQGISLEDGAGGTTRSAERRVGQEGVRTGRYGGRADT